MCPSLLAIPTESMMLTAPEAPCDAALTLGPCTREDAAMLGARFAAMTPWSRYPIGAAVLERYLAAGEPGAPRFSIRAGGELAGAIGLRLDWLLGPYVQFLGVLPPFQSRGLGSLLLAQLESDAREAGQRNLWVAASDFNARARRFYLRAGFVTVAELEGLIMDGVSEILLRKRL